MRSLSKPPKAKSNPQKKQEQKEVLDKKNPKAQSKKVSKTTFYSPFRYKIQTLNMQDTNEVLSILANYANGIRSETSIKIKKIENSKIYQLQLNDKLVYGVSKCLKMIRSSRESIKTVVFFYEQNQHEIFEQLMCLVLYNSISYLILRDGQNLRKQLGIKKMLALGLTSEDLSNHLLKYASRNLLEIPWLVDRNWIPLENKV